VNLTEYHDPQPTGVAIAGSEPRLSTVSLANMPRSLLRAICAGVLLVILVAGLWPFHAPGNEVRWLSPGQGLLFGKYGSIVSAVPFELNGRRADGPCSIELWLEPERLDGSGTILAFYWPQGRTVPLALRQSLDDLLIQLPNQKSQPDPKKARIYAGHVFSRHQGPVFLTISSGVSGTTVYADGALVRQAPGFRVRIGDLTGQLVVGNSPGTTHTWSGQLLELALYDRELSAREAAEHYASLGKGGQVAAGSQITKNPNSGLQGAIALYPFHEGNGGVVRNVAHDRSDAATGNTGPDLLIPERFFVLNEQFLETPWSEYHANWGYWKNVGINIGGFIPLGFFFCAYFAVARNRGAAALTIALGFMVSLTIEVGQAFLPTRDSGITDLITNTFGTALGVAAYAWIMKSDWFAGAGIASQVAVREKREDLQLVE
jgi:hypothetical protein